MLGTLVRGRVSVGGSASSATKLALDIAARYGNVRRQFAAPGDDREIVINDYLVHQRKLLPALATTYALHFAQGELVEHHARRAERRARARRGGRRGGAAGAGVPRRRAQGGPDLARHQDDPDVPRGLRRRRLPAGEPAAAPQGRHRRVHHVRGRQHRPAAAGRQGPAHRLPRHLRLARGLGQGRLHRRHGPRDRAGADGGPRASSPGSSTPSRAGTTRCRCSTAAGS